MLCHVTTPFRARENDMFTHLLFLPVTTDDFETVGVEIDSSVNAVIEYSNPA